MLLTVKITKLCMLNVGKFINIDKKQYGLKIVRCELCTQFTY